MSTIAWDGKALAVDRQGNNSGQRILCDKHRVSDGVVVAWTGEQERGLLLAEWYFNGADPEDWPDFQTEGKDFTRLIVFSGGKVVEYESLPVAQEVQDNFAAWGSGRDFALGAMALGSDAKGAIGVASTLDLYTGMGVVCFG